jgi:hypothetical protein
MRSRPGAQHQSAECSIASCVVLERMHMLSWFGARVCWIISRTRPFAVPQENALLAALVRYDHFLFLKEQIKDIIIR